MNHLLLGATLAVIAAICWGINSHLVKRGMRDGQDAYLALFVRSLVAFPILFIIVSITNSPKQLLVYARPEILGWVILSSALIVVGDSIFMYALDRYSVNTILPITSTYPLFSTFWLIASGIEEVGINVLLGTVIIVIGVALVNSGNQSFEFSFRPILIGLFVAMNWGTSIFVVRNIFAQPDVEPMGLTGVRLMFIGFLALVVFLIRKDGIASQKRRSKKAVKESILYISLSGLVGWVIGASVFFWAIQIAGAAIPTPISSTNPIIASLVGLTLGIEDVSRKQFAGIVGSVLGTIIVLI